jgi:hypothetical protein
MLTESELQLSSIALLGSKVVLGSRLTRFSSILACEGRTIPSSAPHPATRNDCAMVKGLLTCSWTYVFLDFRPVGRQRLVVTNFVAFQIDPRGMMRQSTPSLLTPVHLGFQSQQAHTVWNRFVQIVRWCFRMIQIS